MDRTRVSATLGTHHERGLARESRKGDRAIDILGDFLGERGLAGAGIPEEPEQLRLAAFQPRGDGFQRRVLLRRPNHAHSIAKLIGFWFIVLKHP